MQNIDEVHIEIDLLQGTEQGVQTLRERLYKLSARLALARKHAKELENDF